MRVSKCVRNPQICCGNIADPQQNPLLGILNTLISFIYVHCIIHYKIHRGKSATDPHQNPPDLVQICRCGSTCEKAAPFPLKTIRSISIPCSGTFIIFKGTCTYNFWSPLHARWAKWNPAEMSVIHVRFKKNMGENVSILLGTDIYFPPCQLSCTYSILTDFAIITYGNVWRLWISLQPCEYTEVISYSVFFHLLLYMRFHLFYLCQKKYMYNKDHCWRHVAI